VDYVLTEVCVLPKEACDIEEVSSEDEDEEGCDLPMYSIYEKSMYSWTGDLRDPNTKLGAWEKYTTGIGSKLMMKMGWTPGKALPGSQYSREGRVNPVPIKVLPRGKSLDACALAAKRKTQQVIDKKIKNDKKSTSFDAINRMIGDKPKPKFTFKFKPGHLGIMQAEEEIAELTAQLGPSARALASGLGNKTNLGVKMAGINNKLKYFQTEKKKMERKMAREKSEKDAITF